MLIPTSIIKPCIYGIIAPHGFTDFIHAKQFNIIHKLSHIYVSNLGLQYFTTLIHIDYLYNILFLLTSAIHFRHDMPYINYGKKGKEYQLILSLLLITSFPYLSFNFFIGYMTLIHTPNHYKMSWDYIKKDKCISLFLLIVTIGFFYKMDFMNNKISIFNGITQAIVVSHIMYQEKYIFTDYNQTIMNYINKN